MLSVYANDPDLLEGSSRRIWSARSSRRRRARVRPFRELISRNQTNWTVVAAPGRRLGREGVSRCCRPVEQVPRLWDAIGRLCRLDHADPIAAWEAHLAALAARRDFLNAQALRRAEVHADPAPILTIGLPEGHVWVSGRSVSRSGFAFAPNLPTEEVFTIAAQGSRRRRRCGRPSRSATAARSSRTSRCASKRAASSTSTAERGADVLRQLIDTDDGAARLGEVALVPHSSPISQSGLLFYNTLFDENAASHVALGSAYKFTLDGGETMDDEDVRARGRQPQRHPRRLHDRLGRARRRRRAARRARRNR